MNDETDIWETWTVTDVDAAAAWLAARGSAAAPVRTGARRGVVYTQPDGTVAFARAGGVLVFRISTGAQA